MMNRRQFASRTASTLLALQARGLFGASGGRASASPLQAGEFRLRDYLGIYEFPEELLSYSFRFDDGSVKKEDLRLSMRGRKDPLSFQLSDLVEKDGFLTNATVHFRTGLKINEEKTFSLASNNKVPQAPTQQINLEKLEGQRLAIAANQLQIMVPTGNARILNVPVSHAPAPLLAFARESGKWVGNGQLEGPADLLVQQLTAHVVQQGPLFLKYAVTYNFSDNRSYSVELTLQYNEPYVEIDEFASGFGPDDHLAFRFSYKDGVDPNGRLLMANGGYSSGGSQQGASGTYDQGVNPAGLLPIKLGIYTPNSINLPRAIAFWNDNGANAILFALRRLPDWKTSQRALWSATGLPDNLAFYAEKASGDKFVRAAVVGKERHWAIALIPRAEMIVRGVSFGESGATPRPPDRSWLAVSSLNGLLPYGGGPEVRLLLKLNDFSLDRYKDLIFEFPEDSPSPFTLPNSSPDEMTATEYQRAYKRNLAFLAQVGWDMSGELGPNHWGWVKQPEAVNYAHNFPNWSQEDHLRIRSWLVFSAYLMELDTAMPQSNMLGGQPNFAVAYKQILGIASGLFPKHPDAPRWRDTYLAFWSEYLDKYVRKADSDTGAMGGRFTESIACYNYASMESIGLAAAGLKQFDNAQILDRPEFREWARWDMESRLPYRVSGARIVPPQGAHAAMAVIGPGGRWYDVAHALALALKDTAPQLADEWLWTITAGAEGKQPSGLKSSVFYDYGPVFRYDFGGPNEAYLHLQQLDGPNYRWSGAGNGALYFAAKGKVWSWNQPETNGDAFDITKLPALQVGNASLGACPASGVLYDFDFAQYYRADALPPKNQVSAAYRSRGVMLVRGDYLAVFDQLDPARSSTFNWSNVSSGMVWQIFGDTDFKELLRTLTNDSRFPVKISEDESKQFRLPKSSFTVRGHGEFLVPTAGRYKFKTNWTPPTKDVPGGDTVRIYLDDYKIFDGKGPATSELDLEARTYAIRFEYIHASKEPPFIMLSWIRPGKTAFSPIEGEFYRCSYPMPFIQEVKGGPADQLHIVAPDRLSVTPISSGGARIGKEEFIMFSDSVQHLSQDGVTFAGKVAYARAGELALFEGTHLERDGLGLSREDGDFGASVKRTGPGSLEGRVAGRSGGVLRIRLPAGFPVNGLRASVDGSDHPITVQDSNISLPITVSQADGAKAFRIYAQ